MGWERRDNGPGRVYRVFLQERLDCGLDFGIPDEKKRREWDNKGLESCDEGHLVERF